MKKTVIVIEDNLFYQKLLKTILEQAFFKVILLDGSEDILSIVYEHDPFCLIVDMNLKDNIEGLSIIKHVREDIEYRNVPIISISAHMTKIKQLMLEDLSCYYLAKPIEIEKLTSLITQL
jgi:DNA-binding response OmpR family regulator